MGGKHTPNEMSSALGDRRFNDHNATRGRAPPKPAPLPVVFQEEPPCRRSWITRYTPPMPSTFLPLLLYSALALATPLVYTYVEYDLTDTVTRGVVIGASAVIALALLASRTAPALFNIALFFHVGIETHVIDTTLTFAYADDTEQAHMVLAVVSAVVIAAHLIPFLVSDNFFVLTFFAYVGIVVNTAIAIFLLPSELLMISSSATALLAAVLLVAKLECKVCIFSLLRSAICG